MRGRDPDNHEIEDALLERVRAIVPHTSLSIVKGRNGIHRIRARVRSPNGDTFEIDLRKRWPKPEWTWIPW